MSLLFNTLSRFVIFFPPRSKCLIISWVHSLSTVTSELKKIKFVPVYTLSPSICHKVMRLDAMNLVLLLLLLSFKPAFHSPLSISPRGSLVPLPFLPLEWYHLPICGCWYFILITACDSSSLAFHIMYSGFLLLLFFSHSAVSDSLWPHALHHGQGSPSFTISQSLL